MDSTFAWIFSLLHKNNKYGGLSMTEGRFNSFFYLVLCHGMHAVLSGHVAVDATTGFCTLTAEGEKVLKPKAAKSYSPATKAILQGAVAFAKRAEYGRENAATRAPAPDWKFRNQREERAVQDALVKGDAMERAAAEEIVRAAAAGGGAGGAARARGGLGGTGTQGLLGLFKKPKSVGGNAPGTAGGASKENRPGGGGKKVEGPLDRAFAHAQSSAAGIPPGKKRLMDETYADKKEAEEEQEAGGTGGGAAGTGGGGGGGSAGPACGHGMSLKELEEALTMEEGGKYDERALKVVRDFFESSYSKKTYDQVKATLDISIANRGKQTIGTSRARSGAKKKKKGG